MGDESVRLDRLSEIRTELALMSEAEVRVLQLLVEERLAAIVQKLESARVAKTERG